MTSPALFSSRQRLILFVLLGAGFMLSVDFSIHLALTVNVAVTLVSVVLIWFGLRVRGDRRTATTAPPAPKEADKKRAACPD